jgi:hypothetical protein
MDEKKVKKFWQYKGFISLGVLLFFGFFYSEKTVNYLFTKYFASSLFLMIIGWLLAFCWAIVIFFSCYLIIWLEQNKTLKKDFPDAQSKALLLGQWIGILVNLLIQQFTSK